MSRSRVWAVFFVIFLAGAALRIGVNDVYEFAPEDESVYLLTTQWLVQHGWSQYPALVDKYVHAPKEWLYPHPMRWGHYAITTLASRLTGRVDFWILADVSTAAGILSLLLLFLLGRELLGDERALIATLLSITSPLQLAMGRRALQDEVFCASVLLTLWLLALVVRPGERSRRSGTLVCIATIGAATLMLAIKESSALLWPALVAFALLLGDAPVKQLLKRIAAPIVIPPVLYGVITIILSGGIRRYLTFARIVATAGSSSATPFAQQLSTGPWHRPVFDLLILSPLVMVFAAAGAARSRGERPLQAIASFCVLLLAVFGMLAVKNVRYVIPVDPMARLLAASAIVSIFGRRWPAYVLIAAILITELQLFHQVFILSDVYDPVTQNLLQALHVIPQ